MNVLRHVLAVLLPPLCVFVERGAGRTFWINVVLTLLAYIPGVVHAVWIVRRS